MYDNGYKRSEEEIEARIEGIKDIDIDFKSDDLMSFIRELEQEHKMGKQRRDALRNSVTDKFEKTGTYEFYKNVLAGKYSDKDKGYIATIVGNDCKDYVFSGNIYSDNAERFIDYIADSVEKMAFIADSRFVAGYAPEAMSKAVCSMEGNISGKYVYKTAVGSIGKRLGDLRSKASGIPKIVTWKKVLENIIPAVLIMAVILVLLFYPPVVEWFAGRGGYDLSTGIGAVGIIIGLFTGGFWGAAGFFVVYAAGFGILNKFMTAGEYIKWIILLPVIGLDGILWWNVADKIKGKARYERSKSKRDAITEEISEYITYIRTLKEKVLEMDGDEESEKIIDTYYSGIIRELNRMSYM